MANTIERSSRIGIFDRLECDLFKITFDMESSDGLKEYAAMIEDYHSMDGISTILDSTVDGKISGRIIDKKEEEVYRIREIYFHCAGADRNVMLDFDEYLSLGRPKRLSATSKIFITPLD